MFTLNSKCPLSEAVLRSLLCAPCVVQPQMSFQSTGSQCNVKKDVQLCLTATYFKTLNSLVLHLPGPNWNTMSKAQNPLKNGVLAKWKNDEYPVL